MDASLPLDRARAAFQQFGALGTSARADVRAALGQAERVLRARTARARHYAAALIDRGRAHLERIAAAKIKARVKPPIVAALVGAGIALAVAIAAWLR